MQVTTVDGRRIDALKFDSTGRCSIANALLQGGRQNRFLRCVQEVLCRAHYPRQRFVLGRLDPNAPFIWLTFSNNPDDLANDEERKLFKELTLLAKQTRERDLELEGKEADDPMWANKVVRYRYASHEKLIWDTLMEHHGNHDAIEQAFRNSLNTRENEGVVLIDDDREDTAEVEDWEARGVTLETWRDLLSDANARPQLPSQRREAYAAEITALAKQQAGPAGNLLKYQYPTCFESRDQKAYFRQELQRAKSDPDKYRTSVQAKARLRAMGIIAAPAPRNNGDEDRKPPPDPPAPPAPKENKRSPLGGLGQQPQQPQEQPPQPQQQKSPSRKRPREEEEKPPSRFAFLKVAASAAPAPKPRVGSSSPPPGIADMFEACMAAEADATTEAKENPPEQQPLASEVPDTTDEPPKKKRKKMKRVVHDHSDDGEDLEQYFQEQAAALGWQDKEVGGPVTGETEDDEPPEVDSEVDMESSKARCLWEEKESLRLAGQEDEEAAAEGADDLV